MIRRLKLKFVAICMAMVTAVLAAVFLSVYFAMERNIESLSRQVLHEVISDQPYVSVTPAVPAEGRIPPDFGITIDDQAMLPYFTVDLWGGTAYVTGGTYADLENTDALAEILSDCLSQNLPEGTVGSYHLRYLRQDNGLYQKLAFVDMSMETAMLRRTMRSYLEIALAAFLVLLGVSILLSRWATAPVEKAWKQQRQFLSDASHELKTPLTVILSNAEMLESAALEERPARWTDNIHSEARQMKTLVEEMLTLARSDNQVRTAVLSEASLSDIAADCALAFEPVAFEAGKSLEYQITDGVAVLGDGDRLRRLISILLDNAVKYGADGGTVTLSLEKTDRQARLTVSNPSKRNSKKQHCRPRLFFYQK